MLFAADQLISDLSTMTGYYSCDYRAPDAGLEFLSSETVPSYFANQMIW